MAAVAILSLKAWILFLCQATSASIKTLNRYQPLASVVAPVIHRIDNGFPDCVVGEILDLRRFGTDTVFRDNRAKEKVA